MLPPQIIIAGFVGYLAYQGYKLIFENPSGTINPKSEKTEKPEKPDDKPIDVEPEKNLDSSKIKKTKTEADLGDHDDPEADQGDHDDPAADQGEGNNNEI